MYRPKVGDEVILLNNDKRYYGGLDYLIGDVVKVGRKYVTISYNGTDYLFDISRLAGYDNDLFVPKQDTFIQLDMFAGTKQDYFNREERKVLLDEIKNKLDTFDIISLKTISLIMEGYENE